MKLTSAIGWTDPRSAEGELLRPRQFGPEQVAGAKLRLGTIGYRAKHQQDPQTREGYRFKAAWLTGRWRRVGDEFVLSRPNLPDSRFPVKNVRLRFGTADGAASVRTSADYTTVSAWLVSPKNDLLWVGCRRERAEIPDQPALLQAEYDRHKLDWVGIEACASNVALLQHAGRTPMNVKRLDPEGKDKLSRATPAIVFAEAGRLYLPAPGEAPGYPWDAAEAELLAFTGDEKVDAHDDVVDTLGYAVKWLGANLHKEPAPLPVAVGGLPDLLPRRPGWSANGIRPAGLPAGAAPAVAADVPGAKSRYQPRYGQ